MTYPLTNTNSLADVLANWIVGLSPGCANFDVMSGLDLQSLEDRVLYSAGPLPMDMGTAETAGVDVEAHEYFESVDAQLNFVADALDAYEAFETDSFLLDATLGSDAADFNLLEPSAELVIVDTSVDGYEQLVNDLLSQGTSERGIEVVYLGQESNGVHQITSLLQSRSGLSAIHLITHGQDGELRLGNSILNSESLNELSGEIASWKDSLQDGADLLLYGCNVAETEVGERFVEGLAELLESDVFASSNVTGGQAVGGDWYFEFSVGVVETELAFTENVVANWGYTLGLPAATLGAPGDTGYTSENPTVAADYVGNLLIVTSSQEIPGNVGLDVYASMRDTSGTEIVSNQKINTGVTGNQFDAVVAMADSGDSIIVWTSNAGGGHNIFATILDSDGSVEVSEFQVNDIGTTAENASVAISNNGQIVIAWQGSGTFDSDGVYAKRFNVYGEELSDVLTVNGNASNIQASPDVDINEAGEFVVGWTDFEASLTTQEMQFSIFDSANQRVVTEETGLSSLGKYFISTSIAIDESRHVVFSATESPTAAAQGLEDFLGTQTLTDNIRAEVIAYDSNWVIQSGARQTIAVHDYSYDYGDQFNSTLTIANGEIVIAWESANGTTVSDGLYYRKFDVTNGSSIAPGVTTFRGATDQYETAADLVSFHNGEAWAVVWKDLEPTIPTTEHAWSQTYSNAPPTGQDGSQSVFEDVAYTILESDFGYADGEFPLLGQIEIESIPISGVLLLNGQRVDVGDEVSGDEIRLGNLVYLSAADASSDNLPGGVTEFSFRVNDGYADAISTNTLTFTIQASADETGVAAGNVLVPVDGEVIVNETLLGEQVNYDVEALNGSNYVVVWQDNSDGKIYQRRYDASGAITDPTQVDGGQGGSGQSVPEVVRLNDGGYLITWTLDTGSGLDVYARRFDGNGDEIAFNGTGSSNSVLISEASAGQQFHPDVAPLTDGGFVFAWTTLTANGGSGADIVVRVFNGNGGSSSEVLVNAGSTTGSQRNVVVESLDGNRFVVGWSDEAVGQTDLKMRIFDAGDLQSGVESTIHFTTANVQSNLDIVALSNGNFVATWESVISTVGIGNNVYATIFDADGNVVSTPTEIQVSQTVVNHQDAPSIVGLPDGGFLAVWDSAGNLDGDGSAIFGRRFDASGVAVGDEFVVNTHHYGNQTAPEAVMLENGRVAIVWGAADGDNGGANFGAGVYGGVFEFGVVGNEDTSIPLHISALVSDLDGSESFDSIVISGIPDGAILTDGIKFTLDGTPSVDVSKDGWNIANLHVIPAPDSIVDFQLTIATTTIEASGDTSNTVSQVLNVEVEPQSDPIMLPGLNRNTSGGVSTTIAVGDLTTGNSDVDILNTLYVPDGLFDQSSMATTPNMSNVYVWQNKVEIKNISLDGNGVSYVADSGSSLANMNGAYEFNGTSGGTIDKNAIDWFFLEEGAVEIWLKPDSLTGKKIILDRSNADSGTLLYQDGSNIVLEFFDKNSYGGGIDNQPTRLIASGLIASEFNQIVFAIDANGDLAGSSDKVDIQLYLNGRMVDQAVDVPTIDIEVNLAEGNVGLGQFLGTTYVTTSEFTNFTGQISRFEVYEEAASVDEVETRFVNEYNAPEVIQVDGNTYAAGAVINLASGAQLTIESNGDLTYDPMAFVGSDSFSYRVANGSGEVQDVTVSIEVSSPNSVPVITPSPVGSTNEEVLLSGDLNDFVSDADVADIHSFTKTGDPSNGSVSISSNGTFTYTPAQDFFGTDSFDFQVDDGNGGIVSGTYVVTVDNVNDSPVIGNNSLLTVADSSTGNVISSLLLSEADIDDDGTEVTFTITTNVTNGTLRLNGTPLGLNGTFDQADIDAGLLTYDHNGSAVTSDSFQFSLSDGGEAGSVPATGQFDIAIFNDNYAPTDLSGGVEINNDGGNNLYFAVNDGASTSLLNGLSRLTFESSFSIDTAPTGTATLLSYHATGSDELTVWFNNVGKISVEIKGTVLQSTNSFGQLFDGDKHHFAFSWNSDGGIVQIFVDGQFVETFQGVHAGESLLNDGVLVLGQEQDSENGGFSSTDVFQGTLYDVRVWGEDRTANEIEANFKHKFDSGNVPTALVANWQMESLTGAEDLIVDLVNPGSADLKLLSIAPGAGYSASVANDQYVVSEFAINGESVGYVVPTDIENVDSILSDGSFNSQAIVNPNFTTFAFDGSYSGSQFGDWAIVQNAIDVRGSDWELSPNGGQAVDLAGGNNIGVTGRGIIEQSMTTVVGQEYQITFAMSGNFEGGATQHNLNVNLNGDSNTFSFAEPVGWNRTNLQWESKAFTFTANSTTTVIQFEALTGSARGAMIGDVNVTASSSVPPGDYAYAIIGGTGEFEIDAATGEVKVLDSSLLDYESTPFYDVTIEVTDAAGPTYQEIIRIQVGDRNDSPTIATNLTLNVVEGSTMNVVSSSLLNEGDVDDDGDDLTYTISTTVSQGTLYRSGVVLGNGETFTQGDINAGVITYNHGGGENGTDQFTFQLTDGGEDGAIGANGTFEISVSPANDAPAITTSAPTFLEGSLGNVIDNTMLIEADPDDGGSGLVFTLTADVQNGDLFLNAVLLNLNDTFTQDAVDNGELTYSHNGSETTTDQFSFTLADGGEDGSLPASGSLTINLTPVNDSPSVSNNGGSFYEGTSGNIIASSMLNETDPDDSGAGLLYTITSLPTKGDLLLNGSPVAVNGTFTQADIDAELLRYNHTGADSTPDSFDFSLADGGEDGAVAVVGTFNITVIDVGSDAIALNDSFPVDEDTTLDSNSAGFSLFDNDFDVEGDPFQVIEYTNPANGNLVVNADGSFVYSPDPEFNGTDGFTYTITDSIDGLQHHWGLGRTTSALDLIGGANGTINGTVGGLGLNGAASFFDEVDDYIEIPDVSYGSEFTITFDFKLDDISGTESQFLLSHGVHGNSQSLSVYINESGNLTDPGVLKTIVSDGDDVLGGLHDNHLDIDISSLVGDSNWHRYTLVLDPVNGAKVFLDGIEQGTSDHGQQGLDPSGNLFIGARSDLAANQFFGGGLDTLQVYDRALSGSEAADVTHGFSTATVNITVNAVNDAPDAVDDFYHVGKGNATTIVAGEGLLFNDSDVEGGTLSASHSGVIDTPPNNGTVTVNPDGSFTYTHDGTNTTSDSFTYTVTDDGGESRSATVFLEIEVNGLTNSSEFQVNEDLANSPGADIQDTHQDGSYSDSAVATADNGDYAVVWTGYNGTAETVFMRLFDFSGTPLTDSIAVSQSMTVGLNHSAVVSMANDGKFVVAWANADDGTSSFDGTGSSVYYQTFNADGTASSTILRATDAAFSAGSQTNPDVAMNASGQFALTWQGDGSGGDGADVYINVIDSNGSSLTGGATLLNSVLGGSTEQHVSVAISDNGIVAAFWDDGGTVHGKSFDINSPINIASTSEFESLLYNGALEIRHSSVDIDNVTGLLALAIEVLVPDGVGTNWETHLQVLDLSNPLAFNFPAGNETFVGTQGQASVSFGNDGKIVMTWQGNGVGDSDGVFVRKFEVDTSGVNPVARPLSTEFIVNQTIAGNQQGASVSAIDSQNFVVVWSGAGTGDSNGVFARQFGTQASSQLQGQVTEVDFVNPGDNSNASLSSTTGVIGATVKLYRDDGDGLIGVEDRLIRIGTTGVGGNYSFDNLENGETYWVVVDSKTITNASYNGGYVSNDVWAEQVFGDGGAKIGGRQAGVSDDASSLVTAQHVSQVDVNADVSNIDFGFSFNVVTNTSGGGLEDDDTAGTGQRSVQGSLRQFITNANAIVGANEMHFVPGVAATQSSGADSWWEVAVGNALPEITDAETVIDGRAYDASGFVRLNSNSMMHGAAQAVGLGADGTAGTADDLTVSQLDAPDLEIRDINGVADGIRINASDVEVAYIAIHGFGAGGTNDANIFVGVGGDNVLIHDNMIGMHADLFGPANTVPDSEFNVFVEQADGGRIEDNLIGFTGAGGIKIQGASDLTNPSSNWTIVGNEIRGNASVSNENDGIDVNFSGANISIIGNLIAGNYGHGVDSWNGTGGLIVSDNTIVGNGIGGSETGGIRLFGNGNLVSHNIISSNAGAGVHVIGGYTDGTRVFAASTGNLITENSFSSNGGVAIDLSEPVTNATVFNQGDGVTISDGIANPTSGNLGIDQPVLTSAYIQSDGLHLLGILPSTFGSQQLELYVSESGAGDTYLGTPYGEGGTFLGTINSSNLVSFNAGTGEFEVLLATPVAGWPPSLLSGAVTAIAIESATNNTSEFSNAENVSIGLPPVFSTSNNLSIAENAKVVGNIVASDPDGGPITYSISGGVDQGEFQLNATTGELVFITRPNFELPTDVGLNNQDNVYEVEITATDSSALVATTTFFVSVQDVNEAPTAVDDTASVNEGSSFSRMAIASDPENNGLSYVIITSPLHGSATIDASGRIAYQNNGDETTSDQFEYEVIDSGGLRDRATIFVTINPVDDPTQAVNDRFATGFGSQLVVSHSTILANDIDPDSDKSGMTIIITNGPNHGVVEMVGGRLVFTPDDGFSGSDRIRYRVESGGVIGSVGTISVIVLPPAILTPVDEVKNEPDPAVEPTPEDENPGGGGTGGDSNSGDSADSPSPVIAPNRTVSDLANTIAKDAESGVDQNESTGVRFDQNGTTYAYASRSDEVSLANLTSVYVSSRSGEQVTEFETTLLAGLLWEDLDSAKRNLVQNPFELGATNIAASAASFLTVGYLAWIIRGGVLLTTFMSSVPAWSSFDIQSLIESANGGDESIEQMVDS